MKKKQTAIAQQTNGLSMYENFKKSRAKERTEKPEFNEEFLEHLHENGLTRSMFETIGQLASLESWSGELNANMILVSGVINNKNVGFHFVKLEKGQFGKAKVCSQYQEQLSYFDSEEYKHTQNLRQSELKEFLGGREWFVYDTGAQKISRQEVQPQLRKQEAAAPVKAVKFELFHYSDKSVALFGDTKEYKDMLKKDPFNGVPNPRLTHPVTEKKTFGWILSNDLETIQALQETFSITIKAKSKKVA